MAACVTLPLGAVDATFQFFRFTPTKLRNDATANSVQLAEFQYKHQGTVIFAVDVTNPEGNNPAAETPPLANDDDLLTKWLDFNKGPLVYDMGAQVTIDSYAFATANDATERDPVSWKIEGSNDGNDWTVLDQFTDFATPTERRVFTDDFLLPSTLPPAIISFAPAAPTVIQGRSTTLSWETVGATTVSINQGIGAVAPTGSGTVTPAATTTYTLTANSLGGTLTAQTTVTVVPSAPRTFQFFRFFPTALRTAAANSIQLAEFELLDTSETAIPGATVTNPDGDNPGGENVENVIDGSVDTKWLDFNKGTLVFEFPTPVQVESYRFSTANDASERDPVSWRLEGSTDGIAWEVLHQVTGFTPPTQRKAFTHAIPLPAGGVPPLIDFRISPIIAAPGTPMTLSWDVVGAVTTSIDQGIGTVPPSGTQTVTPSSTTTYTLTATNSLGPTTRSVTAAFGTPGPVTFRHFRFTQTNLRDNVAANSIQLAEFNFSNGGVDLDMSGVTATNPGGRNPTNETPPLVVDANTATKWLDFNKGPLVLDFGAPVTVDAYTFTTANDAIERDPVSWTLEGSTDGTNWTAIDSQEDFPTPDTRFTMTDPIQTLATGPSFPPFQITTVTRNNGTQEVTLTWQSVAGAHYNVQRSSTLASGGWANVLDRRRVARDIHHQHPDRPDASHWVLSGPADRLRPPVLFPMARF